MFIDTHTHIFPEKIAAKAIRTLELKADAGMGKENILPAKTDGTLEGLKRSMRESGTDYSLVLPIATKPSQFDSINAYAASINGKDNVFSFGSIHPDCENIEEKLAFVKSLGLKGIKLHPDYQDFFIEEERCVRVIRACLELGLYVVFHSGWDIAYPDISHCRAKQFAETYGPMLKEFDEEKNPHIILAHLGGLTTFDATLKYICGLPVRLDMAFTLGMNGTADIMSIIRTHGAEKIMYGTDSPWQGQKYCIDRFETLPLTDREHELISHENAAKILF